MEIKEHQNKAIKSIINEKTLINYGSPYKKDEELEKQIQGRFNRKDNKMMKKQFLDSVLKDTDVKKQKKSKNRDVR